MPREKGNLFGVGRSGKLENYFRRLIMKIKSSVLFLMLMVVCLILSSSVLAVFKRKIGLVLIFCR